MTKVFVFLGNERPELSSSRHNAGFLAAEKIYCYPLILKKS